jgi:uncharacterized protein YoxC
MRTRSIVTAATIATLLAACGVADVGVTAASNAKSQAEQLKQGKETIDKVQGDVDAATKAAEQRLQKADAEQR